MVLIDLFMVLNEINENDCLGNIKMCWMFLNFLNKVIS